MNLTCGYITCRREPHFEWFFDSLRTQQGVEIVKQIIIVDSYAEIYDGRTQRDVESRRDKVFEAAKGLGTITQWVPPKPSVWRGRHRLTKEDWWAIACCKNTIICLATQPWVSFCDDRSVLVPTWLAAVKEAMEKNYIVAGAYEKVHNLMVEKGVILGYDKPGDGMDFRYPKNGRMQPQMIGGNSFYGCTGALPLEWALEVNGLPEVCDGLGLEDCLFGAVLDNCGKPFFYDPKMKIVEDRTPAALEPPPKRTDKNPSPNDKSHALKHMVEVLKRCNPEIDLREIRKTVLAGGAFPIPTGPDRDWYDGELLSEMTVR